MMKTGLVRLAAVLAVVVFAAQGLRAQATRRAAAGPPAAVLDAASVWRMYNVIKPPVILADGAPKTALTAKGWINQETPEPPKGWAAPEFDDGTWLRGTARSFSQTPCLARLCLRGRFEVTDLAAVKDLQLTLTYYGGAVVYVNGREIARGNVGGKAGEPVALADAYPKEAFVAEDGTLLPAGYMISRFPKGVAARQRSLANLAIPADALRKGVNVIAVEIVRAPYDSVVNVKPAAPGERNPKIAPGFPYELGWNTCEVQAVALKAASAGGLVRNARPEGVQVWNGDFLTSDFTSDFGAPGEGLRPVAIQGARNGVYSGKVVVGSPKAIAGLKATCTDLKQGAAAIPASAVRIRYAFPWGTMSTNSYANSGRVIDGLLEVPPGEFPVADKGGGAVVPIWVTVKVPKDAKPGAYEGRLTIEAQGLKPIQVPVQLNVLEWALPDTQDWRTWAELIESPDTLVAEYKVPFWSDKHFAMISDAMRYIGETGSRVVYVPLIAETNFGNEQSMVRWIRKGEGKYEYDLSVMEKYLDAAEKNMGKPKMVVFGAWEVYLNPPKQEVIIKDTDNDYIKMEKSWQAARWAQRDKGPVVTMLDPATGKIESNYLPRYEDPAAKPLWQPLYAELRKRLEKRGLSGAMRLGMSSDYQPSKAELLVLNELSGDVPWISHCHGGSHANRKLQGVAMLDYVSYVWECQYPKDPEKGRTYGWQRPDLTAQYVRFGSLNVWPPTSLLVLEEMNIAGQQRGVGRIGADTWATVKDKQGRRQGYVWGRYPQSLWHSLNLSSHMLVPGPDGPVASVRLEYLREGIQQCEARIALESVLTHDAARAKLGADLAGRCQELLDQRLRDACRGGSGLQPSRPDYPVDAASFLGGVTGNAWYVGSGWQERAAQLYRMAAEVAAKTK